MSPWFGQAVAAQRGALALPAAVDRLFGQWPAQDGARVCAIAAHTLAHDGRPAAAWQPWLALAAAGQIELQDFGLARALALLARVHAELSPRLPAAPSRRVDGQALNHALGLGPAPPRPDAGRLALVEEGFDALGVDDAYGLLADAISRRDWAACHAAFELLAGFALDAARLQAWDAELSPGYQPLPAALAAVARDAGFALDSLAPATRDWLWPALQSQPGIRPVLWPPVSG